MDENAKRRFKQNGRLSEEENIRLAKSVNAKFAFAERIFVQKLYDSENVAREKAEKLKEEIIRLKRDINNQ